MLTSSKGSIDVIDNAVAGVKGIGPEGDPVIANEGLEEGSKGDEDVAEAHEVNIDDPADNPDVGEVKSLYLCL